MVILHVIDVANPSGNGVAVAVENYAKYESKKCDVAVYDLNSNFDVDIKKYNYSEFNGIQDLPEPFNKPDLVVFNEVYKPRYIKLYKECLKRNIKYVIIPHGCLVKEAQKKHRLKKILGNVFLFNKFIKNANAVQYLSKKEKDNSQKFRISKVIISGNGIDISNDKKNRYLNMNLVYIGRYSLYIKGLDLLVKICAKHKNWFVDNNVVINLYGRDSENSIDKLKKMIEEKEVEGIIILNEAIYGKQKEQVILDSYAFIQLSRHEGQPMGIIEALSYGLPCIVTYGTSFGEYINNNNCGYGCNFDADEIFSKIKAMYEDKTKRNIQSENAYKIVRSEYDWKKIISKLIEEYKNL